MSDKFDGNTSLMAYRSNNTRSDLRQDAYANALVSQGLPPLADLAANGKLHVASGGSHAGIAPETAVPTTVANWCLQNNNTGSTCLVVLRVANWLVSGTAGLGIGLVITTDQAVQAAFANVTLSTVKNCLAGGSAALANLNVNKTMSTGGSSWDMVAARSQLAAVEVGAGNVVDVQGAYIIQPGGGVMGLTNVSPAGSTPLWTVSILFAEIDLNLA